MFAVAVSEESGCVFPRLSIAEFGRRCGSLRA
ncbi:hypothetical protein M758_7G129300 [Ceratodon purpureus]|uniref:Uncharacterized protein n=1 Tax=Ceratodon purpureus TaxID=3225 RepID=A0A8T0H9U5_CERPU|nr:hypothetical protein KC19_7G147600 [Ceratodon purpureus]KAG0611291.1 hypothetical protein M758_7G129300 [Ceratodon purpureus]